MSRLEKEHTNYDKIILGSDYVVYLMLKDFHVSLNIILWVLDSRTESDNEYFTSDLAN